MRRNKVHLAVSIRVLHELSLSPIPPVRGIARQRHRVYNVYENKGGLYT